MYISLNIDIELTEGQKDEIRKQVEQQLMESFSSETLIKDAVKEVTRGMIKSLVNESIQTKEYRAVVSRKVMNLLMKEERE